MTSATPAQPDGQKGYDAIIVDIGVQRVASVNPDIVDNISDSLRSRNLRDNRGDDSYYPRGNLYESPIPESTVSSDNSLVYDLVGGTLEVTLSTGDKGTVLIGGH